MKTHQVHTRSSPHHHHVKIHAANAETNDLRPQWVDENENDLDKCPFALEGTKEHEEMQEINHRLETLIESAPSDASAELDVEKTRQGYEGILKVTSRDRLFAADFAAPRFSAVIDELFSEVDEQIHEWRKERPELDREH